MGDSARHRVSADYITDPPVPGVDYKGGWCGNPDCPCAAPRGWGTVCEEFMGGGGFGTWCPRCGWHLDHHVAKGWPSGCRTLLSGMWVHVRPGCRCKR